MCFRFFFCRCFLFLFKNTEMQQCTWCVHPRRVLSPLKRWLSSCADIRLQKASYNFSHMHFSYWLWWMSNLSSQCAAGSQMRFLASGLYSCVSGHRDQRTRHRPSRLHCFTVSVGVLREYPASEYLASVSRTVIRRWKRGRFKLLSAGR